MAKIDLKSISGIPITYENGQLSFKDFNYREIVTVTIDDVREQLLNQDLDCPETFYTVYKWIDFNSVLKSRQIRANIYVIPPNLAGVEFVKTRVTRCKNYPRIIEVLSGYGMVLIQQYKSPRDNRIIKISVKKGSKIIIPAGYDFVAVNTRQSSTLIFAEFQNSEAVTRVVLDDSSGMAYYIIRKNAKQEIVRNPSYKIVSDIQKVNIDAILSQQGVTLKTPVIKQIIRKYEKFEWLLKKDSVTI